MQKIVNELKLDFDDVLIKPKRSMLGSRSDVSLYREFKFANSTRRLNCVPIMVANMDTTGTLSMSRVTDDHKCITCLHKHYPVDILVDHFKHGHTFSFYSTGISGSDIEKMDLVFSKLKSFGISVPNICVDVANGYSEKFVRTVRSFREKYEDIIIMAGNVVTPEMVEELIFHGKVDIVKVGIGSGSVCTTRLKTGIGYPQLSAVMECSDAAHGLGGHICSDGGCKTPADVCKAFGGNADFVMLGGMIAGTDCCEGEWDYEYLCNRAGIAGEFWQPFPPGYETEKRKVKLKFYGMSSKEAMNKHNGGVADYRTSEGRCVTIPYKGLTSEVIMDILGGVRSACTYIGASKIKDFGKKTTFIQVNNTHNRIYEKS